MSGRTVFRWAMIAVFALLTYGRIVEQPDALRAVINVSFLWYFVFAFRRAAVPEGGNDRE